MSSAPLPNHHPPLLEITPTDHGAWIAIATGVGLSCALATFLIRIFTRLAISPPFGWDDASIALATALAVIQSSVVLFAVSNGLGKSLELLHPGGLEAIEKSIYSSDILSLFTVYISKCSVLLLLLRLTSDHWHRVAFRSTIAASTIWVLASILTMAIRCDHSRPWLLYHQQCPGLLLRWRIIDALNIITEAIIFSMSIYLVYGLHMAFGKKAVVVGAFGLRLVVIPFQIYHTLSFPRRHLSTNPSFVLDQFSVMTQTVLYIDLMTTTVPCLKPFVVGLSTGYGAFDIEHVAHQTYGYPSGSAESASRNESNRYLNKSRLSDANVLSGYLGGSRSTGKKNYSIVAKEKAAMGVVSTNPSFQACAAYQAATSMMRIQNFDRHNNEANIDVPNYQTEVIARQDGNNSIGSNDSKQMIIRKDMDFNIEYST